MYPICQLLNSLENWKDRAFNQVRYKTPEGGTHKTHVIQPCSMHTQETDN